MSTLTSAQLCVKRSSTRLHAPPGGHSSLSFGPGGFGTTDAADKTEADPAAPPSTASSRDGSSYGRNTELSSFYGRNTRPPPSSGPTSNYYAISTPSLSPPLSSFGREDDPRGSFVPPSSAGARGQSASSAASRWGAQPPLTASKRDQNWERKRRLWLARKNAGGGSDAPPPFQGGGWPGPATGDGGPMGPAMPPASPLTKFMHQHADRLPTAAPSTPASYEYGADRGPRGTDEGAYTYYPPPTAAGGRSSPYLDTFGPDPPHSSHSHRGTSAASATTTRAGSRQPPGGRSNWSPFN